MSNIAEEVFSEEERVYLEHLRAFIISYYRELTAGLSWDGCEAYGPYRGKDQGLAFFVSAVVQLELERAELTVGEWEIVSGGGGHSGIYEPDSGERFPHVWLKNTEKGIILDLACEYITSEVLFVVQLDDPRYQDDINVAEISHRMMVVDRFISATFNEWYSGGHRVSCGSQGSSVLIS